MTLSPYPPPRTRDTPTCLRSLGLHRQCETTCLHDSCPRMCNYRYLLPQLWVEASTMPQDASYAYLHASKTPQTQPSHPTCFHSFERLSRCPRRTPRPPHLLSRPQLVSKPPEGIVNVMLLASATLRHILSILSLASTALEFNALPVHLLRQVYLEGLFRFQEGSRRVSKRIWNSMRFGGRLGLDLGPSWGPMLGHVGSIFGVFPALVLELASGAVL